MRQRAATGRGPVRPEWILGAVSLIVALVMVELTLRYIAGIDPRYYDNSGSQRYVTPAFDNPRDNPFDFPLGMRVTKPGSESWLCGSPVRINAQGMRADREYAYEQPEGTLRFMFIGDSVTFGNTAYKDGIVAFFRGAVEDRLSGVDIEVPNFSCPAWGLPQYQVAIEKAASHFEMDHLVVNFVMNDLPKGPGEKPANPSNSQRAGPVGGHPFLRTIYRHSAIGTALVWSLKGVFARRAPDPLLAILVERDEELARRVEWARPRFRAFAEWAARRDVRLTIVFWPYAIQLDEDLARSVLKEWYGLPFDPRMLERRPQALLLAMCANERLECLDASRAFEVAEEPIEELYFETPEGRIDYIHFSPAGNRVAGEWLAETLTGRHDRSAPGSL